MDVLSRNDNEKLASFALGKYGKIDAVFLNAGVMPSSPLAELEVQN